ncbi:hypothetical protein OCAR_4617 [Afipia carboxidovorans OM5]|nr:hypothetical protein OCAR_4617 [Afipia carboxidovorans OM5]
MKDVNSLMNYVHPLSDKGENLPAIVDGQMATIGCQNL